MIRGLHAMFHSSQAAEPRTFFRVPGNFTVQRYQPKYK
jgi:hypothetical protein